MERVAIEQPTAIVITGPVGAGKSTTAWELRELLGKSGVPNVLFDLDYLRMVYPEPVDDPFAAELGYKVLADAWRHAQAINVGEAGPLRIAIIADVVESREQKAKYEQAMPGTNVTIVRLNVPIEVLHARLRSRESEQSLPWYLDRSVTLQRIMEREHVGDVVVDVNHDSPDTVARRVANMCLLAHNSGGW